jgi:hypothetical protein
MHYMELLTQVCCDNSLLSQLRVVFLSNHMHHSSMWRKLKDLLAVHGTFGPYLIDSKFLVTSRLDLTE